MKRYALLYLLSLAVFAAAPAAASAATMSFGGPSSVSAGDTFTVPVLVSTAASESANAISGTVTYSANLLTLIAVSKIGSIITLWPSAPTQSAGSAQFEGIILNPGYSGANGTVVTLTFQAKAAGVAAVAFSDASVLANDGNATPILSGTLPDSVTITAAPVKPAPVPGKVPSKPAPPTMVVPPSPEASTAPATTTAPTFALQGSLNGIGYSMLALMALIFLVVAAILVRYVLYLLGYELVIRRKRKK